ncbi:MAG: DUF3313 domain-containing protein [Geminicoccaceae bacterium]
MKMPSILILAGAALLLAGCAQSKQASEVQSTGFLGSDYDKLREGEEGELLLIFRDPDADWPAYDRIKLDPVTIWAGEESAFDDFSAADQQALAEAFYSAMREELSPDYPMADTLGAGVLQVQIALTDAQESSPALDTISSVVPIGLALSQAKGLATGKPGFVGEASIEIRILDGQTGQLLAAAADRRVGGKSIGGAVDSWDDVQESFEYWAEQLRYRLCTDRGASNCVPPEA